MPATLNAHPCDETEKSETRYLVTYKIVSGRRREEPLTKLNCAHETIGTTPGIAGNGPGHRH